MVGTWKRLLRGRGLPDCGDRGGDTPGEPVRGELPWDRISGDGGLRHRPEPAGREVWTSEAPTPGCLWASSDCRRMRSGGSSQQSGDPQLSARASEEQRLQVEHTC